MFDQLDIQDAPDLNTRLRFTGHQVADSVFRNIAGESGARIEDDLGILGAFGGFSCIESAPHAVREAGQTFADSDVRVAQASNGHRSVFGDLPNRGSLEDRLSHISLALTPAGFSGAPVSIGVVRETMAHVDATVRGCTFGNPRLAVEHMPGDHPTGVVRRVSPKACAIIELYEGPTTRRATVFGFAIQRGLTLSWEEPDPLLAFRIVVQGAMSMAKLDPERSAAPRAEP